MPRKSFFSLNYCNNSEERVVNLGSMGLPSLPALGYCNYRNPRSALHGSLPAKHLGICFCVRNTLMLNVAERAYRVAPGDVFVLQPGLRHTIGEHPKGLIMYWLILRLESPGTTFLQQVEHEATALRQALANLPFRHFHGNERIKRLFQSLHLLYDAPNDQLRTLRLRTLLLELLLETLSVARRHTVPAHETRLANLLREMQEHPEEEFSIDQLARRAGMAPTYFIKRFRMFAGLPPRQFLLSCRVKKAQELIATTDLPITEIAMQLNFCTSQHFANLFKRHTGYTPRAYRARAARAAL